MGGPAAETSNPAVAKLREPAEVAADEPTSARPGVVPGDPPSGESERADRAAGRPWNRRRHPVESSANEDDPHRLKIERAEMAFGFRGTSTRTSFGPSSASNASSLSSHGGAAFSIAMRGDIFERRGDSLSRILVAMALGGGTSGFEGEIEGSGTSGVRGALSRDTGMFVRAGWKAFYSANKLMTTSLVQLPRGEFGYQYLARDGMFELGVQGGPALVGRFNTDDFSRKLGGTLGYGLISHASYGVLWADISLTRFQTESHDRAAPVDSFQGLVCALIEKMSLCADGRFWRTPILSASGSGLPDVESRASYFGIQIGGGEIGMTNSHRRSD